MPPRAFKFRFAALLKYRKRLLDRLALELADLQRRILEREAEASDLERRYSACTADLAERIAGKVDPEQVIMYHNYLNLLSDRIQLLQEDIIRLNGEVRDKTKQTVGASKDKKIVERIRKRDMVAFNKLLEDKDRKILDEVGANRASAMRRDVSRIAVQQAK